MISSFLANVAVLVLIVGAYVKPTTNKSLDGLRLTWNKLCESLNIFHMTKNKT